MIRQPVLRLRPYTRRDHRRVERLIERSRHIHSHLDWNEPAAWLRRAPTMLAFQGRALVAALAAPPDPPDVAWMRLAVVANGVAPQATLNDLWAAVKTELVQQGVARVAALTLELWIEPVLTTWGFAHSHQVMALSRASRPLPDQPHSAATIRPARTSDLNAIATTDNAAFEPPWALSATALHNALTTASYATVAEMDGAIVGYQTTGGGRFGAHLARLAVLPELRGRHIGRALVVDMLRHFERLGAPAVGVNTQDTNAASLRLYEALGFERTGESFPVWQLHLL